MLKQVVVIASVLMLTACGVDASSPSPSASPAPTPVNDPAKLTLGVWGGAAEVAAWGQAARDYNATTDLADVSVTSWRDDASMLSAFADPSAKLPDVFLISRGDLDQLATSHQVEPVDTYLDARNVDIGDEYSRDALEAFSNEHRLQCMPYGVSPQVVYYNTDLVDFPRMQQQGISVPAIESSKSWSWDQFQLAAQDAAKHPGVRPFALTPSLSGLAPFLLSAGGKLSMPEDSSLSLSDESTLDAFGKVLPVLANPALTTTASQARQVQWFKHGKLAMMVGDRSLVPELRAVPDLRWDVLPMPKIDMAATVGDYTGLCLSKRSDRLEDAADLLVALSSEMGVKPVVATGTLVPVNQKVALSSDFLQTDLSPLHSAVFTNTVRNMQVLPFTHQWAALEAAAADAVSALLVPGQLPVSVTEVAKQIDAASTAILAPATPTASP